MLSDCLHTANLSSDLGRLARLTADRDALEHDKAELMDKTDVMMLEITRLRDLSERAHEFHEVFLSFLPLVNRLCN